MVIYPGDWKKTTLGKEYVIIMGQSPASSSYNYSKNGLPLIQGNADIENGITSTKRYTSQPTKICDADSVIMSVRAPVGTISRTNQRVCLGRGVCAIVGKITNFIYYLMKYHEKSWQKLEQGSTFTAVSGKVIRDFEIVIPPNESEQTAIAETLAAFDTHITNLMELITKKKAIRDGALDELMTGRTRLKGFCGDWEVKTLGEVCKISSGFMGDFRLTRGKYRITRIETIADGIVDKSKVGYSNTKPDDSFRLRLGDILYSNINSIAHIGKVAQYKKESELYHGANLLRLVPCVNVSADFLFYLLTSERSRKWARINANPAVNQASINQRLLKSQEIMLPPLDEQIAIADTLSALDKEISSLETERAKISSIRDGAINDLLTGKVRLKIGI